MKLSRVDLLEVLSIAKPALSSKELVPELTHFFFDGDHVTAYNDTIGIEVALPTEFTGGLRGSLLLGLLDKSRAREVEIIAMDDGQFNVKSGAAKLRLAALPADRAVFEFPKLKGKGIPVGPALLEGLTSLLPFVGSDTSIADQLGITCIPEDDDLTLFVTDAKTITRLRVDRPAGFNERVVLSTQFCEQLARLADEKGPTLYLSRDSVVAECSPDVRLFGRLVDTPRPLEFSKVVSEYLERGFTKKLLTIPERLKLALERIMVVLEGIHDEPVKVTFEGERLYLEARGEGRGEVKDTLALDAGHPEMTAYLNPALLVRALSSVDKFALLESCLVLSGPNDFLHLVGKMSRSSK